jgi:hypothetical protein
LIGPSRAVVYTDEVNFEIQLKVKGTTESEDKALITEARNYEESFDETSSICFKNCFCTIEFHVQVVESTTQATILGVQVAKFSKISQKQCFLCGVELVITVAWSRVVKEKGEFMALGRSYGEA